MAAVLCNAICVKPCQACGNCCKHCVNGIVPCCRGLTICCNEFSKFCNTAFSEPLSCLLTFTFVVAGAVGTFAVIAITIKDLDDCKGPMMIWFIVSLVMCVGHIMFAIYGYIRVRNRDKTKENYYMALYQLLVQDPVTAFYILLDIFGFIWCIVGLGWNENCSETVYGTLVSIGLLAWISVSYFIVIYTLFFESVENILCFFFLCIPFMTCPCCFGATLKSSYQRQAEQMQGGEIHSSYNPPVHQTNNDAYGAAVTSHPVPPPSGSHPVPPPSGYQVKNNSYQEEKQGPAVLRVAGNVGSYLWNKATTKSTEPVNKNNSDNRIARV